MQARTDTELLTLREKADDAYYNGTEPILTDKEYDLLIDEMKVRKIYVFKVGHTLREADNRVLLPHWLGSLDKITTEEKLKKWLDKYRTVKTPAWAPYGIVLNTSQRARFPEGTSLLISEKLDGVSCLLHNGRLYTRGDGTEGADITYLRGIRGVKRVDYTVRGEIIMTRAKYETKYKNEYKNPRNLVSGLVNAKTARIGLNDLCFIAYEIISEKTQTPYDQFKQLRTDGFFVPIHVRISTQECTLDTLSYTLDLFKKKSVFDIDGLVVSADTPYTRNTEKNPDYAFAYKKLEEKNVCDAVVESVEWNLSKNGALKPTVLIHPILYGDITISRASGHNAKYILENKIGPGTKLQITRSNDVIPYILCVNDPTYASLPGKHFTWDDTKTNIYVTEETKDDMQKIKVKRDADFLNKIGAKGVSEKSLEKLYAHGIDGILGILHADVGTIANIPGFKETSAENIKKAVENALAQTNTVELLGASGVFGQGIGLRKVEQLFNHIPDILMCEKGSETYDRLMEVQGFSTNTSVQVMESLSTAREFLEKMRPYIKHEVEVKTEANHELSHVRIVFTGFRNRELEKAVKGINGILQSNVSKNTDLVVTKSLDDTSTKMKNAEKFGIKTVTLEEFQKRYNFFE